MAPAVDPRLDPKAAEIVTAALGVSRAAVRASYARAKRLHAAANADLDTDDGDG